MGLDDLPFLGDTCAWLNAVSGFDSPLRAFDPTMSLYRPLQHLSLWCPVQTGLDRPTTALLPGLLVHIGFVLAVLRLARTAGLDRRGQLAALVTTLSFPVVKALDWAVAISTPARALCTVMAVDAAIRHARVPSRTSGIGIVGWSLASLLAHEQGLATAGLAAVAWWRTLTLRSSSEPSRPAQSCCTSMPASPGSAPSEYRYGTRMRTSVTAHWTGARSQGQAGGQEGATRMAA